MAAIMTVAAMPQEIPPCGRIGCCYQSEHRHGDWGVGDRVVIEPKLATAPGFAYSNPRGVIIAGRHLNITAELVTVQLDGREEPVEVDHHLLTREPTYNRRQQRRSKRQPAPKKRKHALDADKYDEMTLGDYLTDELSMTSRSVRSGTSPATGEADAPPPATERQVPA
jgi:hypothetical protein